MHTNPSLLDALWERKIAFLFAFFVIFTLSYGVFFALDFLPEAPQTSDEATLNEDSDAEAESETPKEVEVEREPVAAIVAPSAPIRLFIPTLDQSITVLNPKESSIAALDAALLKGAVRHPDSALLGAEGNTLIMGHSSYLPTVINKNYQAFNNIQKLNWGDTIVVASSDHEYTYRVEKVYEAKASAVSIPTEVKGKRLTLITCDSFGTKEDRFIVEAVLVDTKTL